MILISGSMGVADLAQNKYCCEQPLQDVKAILSVKPSEENLCPYILIDYPPVDSRFDASIEIMCK